jgi:hypothetical protein
VASKVKGAGAPKRSASSADSRWAIPRSFSPRPLIVGLCLGTQLGAAGARGITPCGPLCCVTLVEVRVGRVQFAYALAMRHAHQLFLPLRQTVKPLGREPVVWV